MTSPVKESGLWNRCSQETDRNGRSGYYLKDLKKKFYTSNFSSILLYKYPKIEHIRLPSIYKYAKHMKAKDV